MTDWAKLKVADLKRECQSREIPLTGLKLKQQYIDKLEELEAQHEDAGQDVEMKQPAAQVNGDNSDSHHAKSDENPYEKDSVPLADAEEQKLEPEEATLEKDVHPILQEEEKRVEENSASEIPATIEEVGVKDGILVQEPVIASEKIEEERQERSDRDTEQVSQNNDALTTVDEQGSAPSPTTSPTPKSVQISSNPSTPRASDLPVADITESQRNRRKRSATPTPSTEEISRKKARLSEDTNEPTANAALEQMKIAAEEVKEDRIETTDAKSQALPIKKGQDGAIELFPSSHHASPPKTETREEARPGSPTRSRSPSEDRDTPPAIHPATSSLYISRLKRPIQPQAFRSHIISKAKSRSSGDDLITAFYVDSIKSHAFVSFTSVSAASRARSAMHGVRFPDEQSREPLFVDYVPDDKVQSWIDQETDSGFGQVSRTKRVFEVVYEDGANGVEAVFQEAGSTKPRPPIEPSRNARMSFDRPQPSIVPTGPSGVHPDRAAFVPRGNRDRDRDLPRAPPTGPKNSAADSGRGFKALDELFNSTTAKPKLYYKVVSSHVANERLDMFRDLRVAHNEMGRSGDEGMKRYSFQKAKDREEWVDKGPEFGHGRKGQDRLTGVDRPFEGGGFRGRGRGGGYRGRGMDSWRGGGR